MGLMTASANGAHMQSGYRGAGRSPVGIGAAIAVHAVAGGLFLLTPREVYAPYVPQILIGNQIPLTPPPPPEKTDQPPESKITPKALPDPLPARVDPAIDIPTTGPDIRTTDTVTNTKPGTVEILPPPPPDPPREAVLREARIDPRALPAFQPEYPGSMVRQGLEGSVTVRVTISPEGRVTAIEQLSATDEAFWIATQRHALRKWRFQPATRDGVATVSSKVMTVHFRLAGI
ncbi:hypothetical protein L288_05755 [Sphingobium quisquiliarum P25]|uniref:Protein TonB n=1 Tax=Sphingobium quisquiliarum P25 TaxID=1329909 RepID=T0GZR9_9SPHN|nr:TonB family protein [Sphingobium quisquiliarum]EQB09491.1 hypothetical protein L288_05755 [Sphingobium quisquiliarum P25]EZP73707.1 Biopolymer transporter TonB [Sphingomonas paucimobilis]